MGVKNCPMRCDHDGRGIENPGARTLEFSPHGMLCEKGRSTDRVRASRRGRKADSDPRVRPSGRWLAGAVTPFIHGMFVEAGLRGAWCGGRIIFDPGDVLKEFGEDEACLLRIFWDEQGGFGSQGENGIFELATLVRFKVRTGRHAHQGSRHDGHDHRGQ